jgi:hypothetical protein
VAPLGVRTTKPTDVLCDESGFGGTYLHGHPLSSDNAHLSDLAAERAIPLLEPTFAHAMASANR